jgi:antitoxin component YwqK of YwqJK toxin-antitoxin module
MKKILILLISLILASGITAQTLSEKDGMYYNPDGTAFTGSIQEKYDNGLVKMTATVEAGLMQGEVVFYSKEGILTEKGNYVDGKKHGVWMQYNAKGVITGEAHYFTGKKDGVWTIWDDNGVKRYHMVYAMGKKIDVWKMWDENSNLVSERVY